MNGKSRTVVHRYTGESITFLEVEPDYTLIKVTLPPEGSGPPLHYHDRFTELFTVLDGKLTITHNKQERMLQAGEELLVPVGATSCVYSETDTENGI